MNLLELSLLERQYAVEQLLARYAQCIDDDRLEAWPDFFPAACDYRIVSRENAERGLPLATLSCDSRAPTFVDADPPAVLVRAGAPATLHEGAEAEADIGRYVGRQA